MKSIERFFVLLIFLLSLPGCLIFARRQTDQPLNAEAVTLVKSGMTKNEVTDKLGAPVEILFSNKEHDPLREHAYIYEYKVDAGTALFFGIVNFGNLDSKRDRVVVFFNDAGKVSYVGKSLKGEDASFGFPFGK